MMKSSAVMSAVLGLMLLLSGCAGTNFTRVADDTLVLGQTTSEQITARLGSPYREGVLTKNNEQLKTAVYAYAATTGEGAADGVTPARSQGFYFFENRLVGYEFSSSWKEDSTNFDATKVAQIKKGESTRADVVRPLGNPGGKGIYPLIPGKDENAVNYLYTQVTGSAFNMKVYQKQLVVTFDKQGVVTNVEFTESGQK
jgi:outer membrane protein assembly factor BamE (lipoprotein component of BamABCDE complex)